MRAVAEGHSFGMLAGAPRDRARFFDLSFERAKAGAFVRAVAERLTLRAAAGAPPIRTSLDFLDDGASLEDDRFVHRVKNTGHPFA